jgi:MFS family permease
VTDVATETWADDRRVKATLIFAGSMSIMAAAIVSPALPQIETVFADAPNAALATGLVLTLPALFVALGAPVVGGLIDRVGRLRVLGSATVLYAVAGTAPVVLDSLAGVLASRAVLGVAVAGLFVTGTALITDYYSGETRSAMLGLQGALASASGIVFLPAAGLLATTGWRGPFVLYAVSLALLPAVVFLLPEPAREDAPETTADGRAGDERGGETGEGAVTDATLPKLSLGAVYGLAFVGMLAFYTLPVQVPFYVEQTTGSGAAVSGGVLAVAMLSGGVVASQYPWFRSRLGIYGTVVGTFLAMGAGLGLLGLASGLPGIVLGVAVVGGAQGSLVPNLNAWAAAVVPDAARGRALSGVITGLFLGQFCSALVAGQALAAVDLETMYAGAGVVLLVVAGAAAVVRLRAGRSPAGVADPAASAEEPTPTTDD